MTALEMAKLLINHDGGYTLSMQVAIDNGLAELLPSIEHEDGHYDRGDYNSALDELIWIHFLDKHDVEPSYEQIQEFKQKLYGEE